MILLTTAVLLVSSALALPTDPPKYPCCPPPRWKANMLDLSSDLSYSITYAVDDQKKVEGAFTQNRLTGEWVSFTLTDYTDKMVYTELNYGDQKGKCIKTVNTNPSFFSCTDNPGLYPSIKDAKYQYIGNATTGGPGPGSILYDAWNVMITDPNNPMNVTISLTRDKCVPLLEKVITPKINSIFLFNDIDTNVEDKLLSKPPACASDVVG